MLAPLLVRRYQKMVIGVAVVAFVSALLGAVGGGSTYWLHYWWMFPIAFAIALAVNTVGISGSALFVPFFILVFPLLSGVTLLPADSVKLGLLTESFGLSSSALAFFAFGLIDTALARGIIMPRAAVHICGRFVHVFCPRCGTVRHDLGTPHRIGAPSPL